MTDANQKILDYLRNGKFPSDHNLNQICWTFEHCSEDDANKKYLVKSQVKAIKFEKLTGWICGNARQAADAMTFSDADIVLIEFKAGDKTKHSSSKAKLIKSVIGKINDSDTTVFQDIIKETEGVDASEVQIAFYLVVDAVEMGIESRTATLLRLSLGSNMLLDPKLQYLINELLPSLKDSTSNPNHFSEIDIWYSDIFDTYLQQYGIIDILLR